MRYRVDLPYDNWASFSEADEDKARALYESEGIRLRLCADLFDDRGVVLEGLPVTVVMNFRKAAAA